LKLSGVTQTTGSISAASGSSPYYEDMWRRYCCLTSFFFRLSIRTCVSCEDMARQNYAMVPKWRFFGEFLGSAFPASRAQHVSDLRSKFALGPHHVSKTRSMVDIQSGTAEIRRGKKIGRKKERNHRQKYTGLPYYIGRPQIKYKS